MKITYKHTMKDLKKYGNIIALDKNFMQKIREEKIPPRIKGIKIKKDREISIQHILMSWNVKDDEKVKEVTAKSYGLEVEKIDEYPLIDFMQLVVKLQDVSTEAGKMFMELKRENKDSEIQSVLEGFTTSDLGLIDRFVTRCNGAYTHDTASDISWYIVYTAFKADTDKYDSELAISELMEKRNGNK